MPGRIVHVIDARSLGGHRVWLVFDDGLSGEIDLAPYLDGPVFEPLRDVATFRRFAIGEGRTLEWENGADFAPEFLHALLRTSRAASSR